jgi:hypothetical protein
MLDSRSELYAVFDRGQSLGGNASKIPNNELISNYIKNTEWKEIDMLIPIE